MDLRPLLGPTPLTPMDEAIVAAERDHLVEFWEITQARLVKDYNDLAALEKSWVAGTGCDLEAAEIRRRMDATLQRMIEVSMKVCQNVARHLYRTHGTQGVLNLMEEEAHGR